MPKRLVICADGTWNEPEQTDGGMPSPTNVVKLAHAVLSQDGRGTPQVVCYHKGVGERGGLWDHLTGGAFGVGISRNIEDLYVFLANNYVEGDEVWLFGFSRGAYTVRSLAGLIRNCGILKREYASKYEEAYQLYRDRRESTGPSSDQAKIFRQAYSHPDFNIHFIGVWDTVGALGIPVTPLRFWTKELYEFHDVELSSHVNFAYQALAVDEKRKPFLPAVWKKQTNSPDSQVLEQAWFPGVHCDVGGGYAQAGLSNGALLWMWNRAEKAGLALDVQQKPIFEASGKQHDSMSFGYRFLGNGTRTLGGTNPIGVEKVAQASLDRMAEVPDYGPENLKGFLSGKPDSSSF